MHPEKNTLFFNPFIPELLNHKKILFKMFVFTFKQVENQVSCLVTGTGFKSQSAMTTIENIVSKCQSYGFLIFVAKKHKSLKLK